jgi:glycosyltransferase involved in cell wall biosynthesis
LLLKGRLEGIGWFTYETLKRITRDHPEHRFLFFFDRPYDEEFIFEKNVTPIVAGPQARHPFLFYLWFEFTVTRLLKKYKADLFLSPDGYLSLRSKVASLAVIHDLNFEHYPNDVPWLIRKYYRYFFPRFARKATRIATVSKASADDIQRQYVIDPSTIDIVYDGANVTFHPLGAEEIAATRHEISDGKPYFVFVGALHPRKNLANLFRAFDLFIENRGTADICLVIVGAKKWWTPAIREAYESMKHRQLVIFSGRLNHEALNRAMAAALATTYVSYFEGFGIPIVESFRCGTPVITSNISSMPEVAGDAALLCDPFDIASMADAMAKISNDGDLRKSLIEKGHLRQEVFTWDRTAELLWRSIEETLASASDSTATKRRS